MMSVCVDKQGCVTGVCPDNLTGGDGWHWMETKLMPSDNLEDANGIALYKLVDGVVVKRTQEELSADLPAIVVEPEPTLETRVEEIEALVKGTPTYGELLEAVNLLLGE